MKKHYSFELCYAAEHELSCQLNILQQIDEQKVHIWFILEFSGATEFAGISVVPPLLSSISQGGVYRKNIFFPALITAMAFSYIRTEFGASRSRHVGVRSAKQ